MLIFTLWACTGGTDAVDAVSTADTAPDEVPWTGSLPRLQQERRGRVLRRAITHLHSPHSHDACDGDPQPGGVVDEDCLQSLRDALCTTAVDVAFLTDHPSHAAASDYDGLFLEREGDRRVDGIASAIPCDDGHESLWIPGIEDDLMPLGLRAHVPGDAAERDATYNADDPATFATLQQAGADVFVAHTEGRELSLLEQHQDAGLRGLEVFNLHAMFAPDIRPEDLGLDPFDWVVAIEPFTSPDGTGEPDLLFLGVLQDQPPSLTAWDALLQRGPMAGIAGTDAHQNVMPIDLRDGERGDSYRRMLRWFSNHLLADDAGPGAAQQAVASGRSYVAFEVLGTPVGFDVYAEGADGAVTAEMGGAAAVGDTLVVTCPTLHPASPRGLEAPEILPTVVRDGEPWQTGCGTFEIDAPGVYRVRVDQVPHHLHPFLGDDPEPWLRPYPWLLSNAVRVPGARR